MRQWWYTSQMMGATKTSTPAAMPTPIMIDGQADSSSSSFPSPGVVVLCEAVVVLGTEVVLGGGGVDVTAGVVFFEKEVLEPSKQWITASLCFSPHSPSCRAQPFTESALIWYFLSQRFTGLQYDWLEWLEMS